MKVRVLGCSGAIARDCRTTSFLIDDDILVDAGTGVGDLSLQEMRGIDDVLLTHSHLDHIAALPLMLDAIGAQRARPVRVHALAGTIEALRAHIFNDTVWPDFSRIPSPQAPYLEFHELQLGQVLSLGARQVEVLPAEHTVPAAGYAVRGGGKFWVFSGDTGRNPRFWERVNALPVGALVIETAFSNREEDLALRSQHLSPSGLAQELAQIAPGQAYPVYITHTKPAETDLIMAEIRQYEAAARSSGARSHDIHWLSAGQVLQL